MGVAASAYHTHPEKDRAKSLNAIKIILGLEFSRDHPTLGSGGIHAYKSRGNLLLHGRGFQQVTSQLPGDEVIKWQVVVEGAHHPIAVRINAPPIVQMKTMGVTITDGIEPKPRLVLAISRVFQELIQPPLVSPGRLVVQVIG